LAKKRRQKIEKKEEYDFNFPEFDEHQFISLELNKAKVALVAFLYAILIVFLTYQLYIITYPDARAPMALGFLAVAAIPFISRFVKINISEFDWKNWVGSGAVYIFSWLAIFIILVNPPFSDFVEPEINEEITYLYDNGSNKIWTKWDTLASEGNTLRNPERINFSIEISDNTQIDKDTVRITIHGTLSNSTLNRNNEKMDHVKDNKFKIEFISNNGPFPEDTYNYEIRVKDSYGNEGATTGKFIIV
jgi:hypothetical protein